MFRSAHLDEGAAQAFQQGVARGLFVHTFDSLPVGLGFGGMGLSQAVEGLRGLRMAVLGDLFVPAAHGAIRDFTLLAPAIFGSLPARLEARLATDFGNLFVGFIFGEPGLAKPVHCACRQALSLSLAGEAGRLPGRGWGFNNGGTLPSSRLMTALRRAMRGWRRSVVFSKTIGTQL